MIDTTLKDSIIELLGKHYAPKIFLYLDEKQIFNADGNSFSFESIRKIVGGNRSNAVVESAIVDFLNDIVAEKKKQARKVSSLKSKTQSHANPK